MYIHSNIESIILYILEVDDILFQFVWKGLEVVKEVICFSLLALYTSSGIHTYISLTVVYHWWHEVTIVSLSTLSSVILHSYVFHLQFLPLCSSLLKLSSTPTFQFILKVVKEFGIVQDLPPLTLPTEHSDGTYVCMYVCTVCYRMI